MATRLCPNCGTKITCGCQIAVASNGVRVCTSCKALYERQLQEKIAKTSQLTQNRLTNRVAPTQNNPDGSTTFGVVIE